MLEKPLQGATSGWVDGGGFITLKCQEGLQIFSV